MSLPFVPDRLEAKDREQVVRWLREMATYIENDARPPWFCCLDKLQENPGSPFVTYRLTLTHPWGG